MTELPREGVAETKDFNVGHIGKWVSTGWAPHTLLAGDGCRARGQVGLWAVLPCHSAT